MSKPKETTPLVDGSADLMERAYSGVEGEPTSNVNVTASNLYNNPSMSLVANSSLVGSRRRSVNFTLATNGSFTGVKNGSFNNSQSFAENRELAQKAATVMTTLADEDREAVQANCICAPFCTCCECCNSWRSVVVLGGFLFLSAMPSVLLSPIQPGLKKQYFGSNDKAAMFQSISDGSVALINFFLVGAYAQLLDTVGRKPLFVAQALFSLLSTVLMLIFEHTAPIWMVCNSLSKIIQTSFILAWVSDQYTPEQRPRAFAVSMSVGPVVGILALAVAVAELPHPILLGTSTGFAALNVLYAFFIVSESYPSVFRRKFSDFTLTTFCNPFTTLKYLCVSRTIMLLTAIIALVVGAAVGTGEVLVYWLDSRVGWGPIDIALNMAETGILSPISLIILYPLLQKRLSPVLMLFGALCALFLVVVLIATIWAKWVMFAFVIPLNSAVQFASPIVLTMIANSGTVADQAKRMTALQLILDLCGAFGPLLFGIAYGNLEGSYLMIPFGVCAVMILVAAGLTWRLSKWVEIDALKRQSEIDESSKRLLLESGLATEADFQEAPDDQSETEKKKEE